MFEARSPVGYDQMSSAVIPEEIRGHRFVEFDSLRGLAAGTVVLHHILRLWEGSRVEQWVRASPAAVVVNGSAAVVLFFVLSGFVLTLPYKLGRAPTYGIYLLKRCCRIYLPYAASLFVALAVLKLVREPVYTGAIQYDQPWNAGIDWHLVLKHLMAIDNFDFNAYDPPYWTLVIEMRISLVMPLIAFLALRSRFFPGLLLGITTNFAAWYAKRFVSHGLVLQILDAGTLFYIGSLLATNFDSVARSYRASARWVRWLLMMLALSLYGFLGRIAPGIPPIGNMMLGCGCVILLLAASQSTRIRHILHHPMVLRLGEVSYSLYLVHMIVLLAIVHSYWGRVSMLAMLPVMISCTYIGAELFHRCIELPTIKLGRRLERTLSPSRSS